MKYTEAKCRLCRREGEKLYLKGTRCYTSKCAIESRPGKVPGQHQRKGRGSHYNVQFRTKQKTKRMYGLTEHQFRLTYQEAERKKGETGINLLHLLESRLDNVVYRMGFGISRAEARQVVSHKSILVNGKSVNIPSYQMSPGDQIEVKDKSKNQLRIQAAVKFVGDNGFPEWIEVDSKKLQGIYKELPKRELLSSTIEEQLIVELYSK